MTAFFHLGDVLNKVFAEGESAAYEPHGDHMVCQGYDILVEPDGDEKRDYSSEGALRS